MSAPTVDLAQYEKLVHQLAWRYARRLPRAWSLSKEALAQEEETLAQEGWLTLVKALRTFRPEAGKFTTYATFALARRFAELTRQEYQRSAFAGPSLDRRGSADRGSRWRSEGRDPAPGRQYSEGRNRGTQTPPQTLVDLRLDLARGQWDGPPLRASQAEEVRERLLALA